MADLTPLRLAVGRTRRHVDQLRRSVHDQRAELDDMRRQLELFEVAVKVGEGVFLDLLGVIAEGTAVGQPAEPAAVACHERAGQPHEGRLQRRVLQRLRGGPQEVVVLVPGVVVHGTRPGTTLRRPPAPGS